MNTEKMKLAAKTLELIIEYAEQGDDWSLLLREYNDLIDIYDLPMQKIGWDKNKIVKYDS